MKQPLLTFVLAAVSLGGPGLASAQLQATGISLSNGTLKITGTSSADSVSVSLNSAGTSVVARRGLITQSYPVASVQRVEFNGGDGDDTFTSSTSHPVRADGGNGDDTLNGGSGDDYLIGNYGDDTLNGNGGRDILFGSGGHDGLYGGSGDDKLKGHGGNDWLSGGTGDDLLYGGSGDDTLDGGGNQDTLVAIGGDHDTVGGGTSNDFFWVDHDDMLSDVTMTEAMGAYVNRVSSFYSYSFDGGETQIAVPKDLTDFDLADPVTQFSGMHLENFSDHPLFPDAGPSADDVTQDDGNDCYILGPLSAVAEHQPEKILKMIVDLDDGTYAVRFYRTETSAAEYVRVDADLWVRDSDDTNPYGPLGEDDSLWVRIFEKALAFYHAETGDYADIEGAGGAQVRLRADKVEHRIDETVYDRTEILDWHQDGEPAGPVRTHVRTGVIELLEWIDDQIDAGIPTYTGYVAGLRDTSTIHIDHWRRGAHIIMIRGITRDQFGTPNGLVLRDQLLFNQATSDFVLRDFTRIYFFIGRGVTFEMP